MVGIKVVEKKNKQREEVGSGEREEGVGRGGCGKRKKGEMGE